MEIKREDINASNVDDYIRERKAKGQRRFFWRGKGLEAFKTFALAVCSDPLAGIPTYGTWVKKDKKGNITQWGWTKGFPRGFYFMGVKHFKKDDK